MRIDASFWHNAATPAWQTWMDLDLTMSQLKLLLLIASCEGSPVGDLAQRLGVTPPTVTTILDRLVEHALVRREADSVDRRLVIARLTPAGEGLLRRLQLLGAIDLSQCIDELDEEELRCLVVGMEALQRIWQNGHREGRVDHARGDADLC